MFDCDLIIPVENQVRELEAKLLLATIAAQQDLSVILGWKGDIDQNIHRFAPGSIYLAKSFAPVNLKMLRLINELGQRIVAWDEEGLVHYPPDIYFRRRFTPDAIPYLDGIIAWGADNDTLLREYQSPFPVPIHVLGNPRGDLLRGELRPFFQPAVDALRARYGAYILLNTNFPSVNSFDPILHTCYEDGNAPEGLAIGRGGQDMPESFARGRYRHVMTLFEHFQSLLPWLAHSYPDHTIIVRPHPSEDHTVWRRIGTSCPNVVVDGTGNVLPWILGSTLLIHNGCTTAVEAHAMRKPVLSYEPHQNPLFDNELPNALSTRCHTRDELAAAVAHALRHPVPTSTNEQTQQLRHFIAAMDGPLACQRIGELLSTLHIGIRRAKQPPPDTRRSAAAQSMIRRAGKTVKRLMGTRRYSQAFQDQRFPALHMETLREQCGTFCRLLALAHGVTIHPLSPTLVRLTAARSSAPSTSDVNERPLPTTSET